MGHSLIHLWCVMIKVTGVELCDGVNTVEEMDNKEVFPFCSVPILFVMVPG